MKVKDSVDFIYGILSDGNWTELSLRHYGQLTAKVGQFLYKRGIITRRTIPRKGKFFEYKWVASSAPTKVLYGNIVNDMREYNNSYNERARKRKIDVETIDAIEHPVMESIQEKANVNPLEPFMDSELLDELKRRGWVIGNGELIKVFHLA